MGVCNEEGDVGKGERGRRKMKKGGLSIKAESGNVKREMPKE